MSERASGEVPQAVSCSGLANPGVPEKRGWGWSEATGLAITGLARPKSITFTANRSEVSASPETSMMLLGFRSRWTNPCFSAPAKARAICSAMSSVADTGNGPSRRTRASNVSPSTSSIA
ncbi:MAG TPA: hypothetical protein VGL29_01605 [Blastocatellia bacterium]